MANYRTLRVFIALYFALYLCLVIPGHLAMFAGELGSVRTVQAAPDNHQHHDLDHCTICVTAGQVAALTIDCPICVYQSTVRLSLPEATPVANGISDRSTDPRAPPSTV